MKTKKSVEAVNKPAMTPDALAALKSAGFSRRESRPRCHQWKWQPGGYVATMVKPKPGSIYFAAGVIWRDSSWARITGKGISRE